MGLFESVKAAVPARAAAEFYGLKVNSYGMACCPFHDDRHPSMKVDNRFYCFGCGAKGDAVDLAAQLLGLGKREAALRLAEEFDVQVDRMLPSQTTVKESKPRAGPDKDLEEWICDATVVLLAYLNLLEEWRVKYAPKYIGDEYWHPLFCEALQKKDRVNDMLDDFMYAKPEEYPALKKSYENEVMCIGKRLEQFI